tara:strand:+ start:885 stop:1136 length:252 start_codon:yes stop_codon:yes gene_type:complete
MNVKECVEFNMKKFDIIRKKINDLEEINFTPEEYHLVFQMAGYDILSNSEMRTLILAFCEKLNPELSPREYDKIKDHHVDLPK